MDFPHLCTMRIDMSLHHVSQRKTVRYYALLLAWPCLKVWSLLSRRPMPSGDWQDLVPDLPGEELLRESGGSGKVLSAKCQGCSTACNPHLWPDAFTIEHLLSLGCMGC